MSEIEGLRKEFNEACKGTERAKRYLYDVILKPSEGYGFSLNHALPYSIIGVQCVLLGGILFPSIYWQTACLLQRAGTLDEKNADYNKIAKAVANIKQQGVNIRAIDINRSEREFTLDAEKGEILYGFDGVKGLRTAIIDKIIEMRPFNSFWDFIVSTGTDITSLVTLVKAGAFDFDQDRLIIAKALSEYKSDQKEKLNGQNLLMLSRENLWPKELAFEQKIFNFTYYLKSSFHL
jgi:DNA polymerase III alpha subunit